MAAGSGSLSRGDNGDSDCIQDRGITCSEAREACILEWLSLVVTMGPKAQWLAPRARVLVTLWGRRDPRGEGGSGCGRKGSERVAGFVPIPTGHPPPLLWAPQPLKSGPRGPESLGQGECTGGGRDPAWGRVRWAGPPAKCCRPTSAHMACALSGGRGGCPLHGMRHGLRVAGWPARGHS